MAISISGILSNSYVAYSKSIAFYIQRVVYWKNKQLRAFYHNQAYPIHHNQLLNQEKKNHTRRIGKTESIKKIKWGKEKNTPTVNSQWDDDGTQAPERGYRGGYGFLVGSSPLSLNWAQTFSFSLNSSGCLALVFIPTRLSHEFLPLVY